MGQTLFRLLLQPRRAHRHRSHTDNDIAVMLSLRTLTPLGAHIRTQYEELWLYSMKNWAVVAVITRYSRILKLSLIRVRLMSG